MIKEVMDKPKGDRLEFHVVSITEEGNDITIRIKTTKEIKPFAKKIFLDAYRKKEPVLVYLEVS